VRVRAPGNVRFSIEDGSGRSDAKGTIAGFKALGTSLLACVLGVSTTLAVNAPVAQAKNGDTHVTGQGSVKPWTATSRRSS
jgi:hypothetical protein